MGLIIVEEKEIYLVPFSHGSHGTWLMWFINQHSNFPDNVSLLEKFNDISNPQRITDYGIKSNKANWFYDKNEITDVLSELSGSYTKVALKLHPHHCLYGETEEVIEDVLLRSNPKNIIIPIVNEICEDKIEKRFNIIRSDKFNIKKQSHQCADLFKDINHSVIDIGKIILKDQNEYNLLLDAIDENPIDNWKELISNSIEEIYNER